MVRFMATGFHATSADLNGPWTMERLLQFCVRAVLNVVPRFAHERGMDAPPDNHVAKMCTFEFASRASCTGSK
jgi:hypothetical protein